MKDPILPLLSRFLTDRIPSTRKELADLSFHVLQSRVKSRPTSLAREDIRLLVILILLSKDETEAVSLQASSVSVLIFIL